MHATITTPFVDTRAADLGYALDQPRLDALEVLTVGPLELRLLGASHQAVLRIDGREHSEVVACLAGAADPLPTRHDRPWGTAGYRFRSAVETLAPARFARRAAQLRDRYRIAEHALVCEFGGLDDAMTILVAEPTGLGWQTWHSYPQTGELVCTRSAVLGRAGHPSAEPQPARGIARPAVSVGGPSGPSTAIPAPEGARTR
ncbi:DUF2617 family protein [Actinocatenispora sera]|uniref:DUF2617 family protein n=1 Tax=Actinocatenispora sera TaxID=390989 RepID=A0A810KZ47_9ACTN|nr:DUF2617 family protein [Actinocatenispora sera]BCJ27288.1 hypothetical protein Asera_13960 [Actinocatenispora sera]